MIDLRRIVLVSTPPFSSSVYPSIDETCRHTRLMIDSSVEL